MHSFSINCSVSFRRSRVSTPGFISAVTANVRSTALYTCRCRRENFPETGIVRV